MTTRNRGVTLVEILMALGIIVAIGVMIVGVVSAATDAVKRIDNAETARRKEIAEHRRQGTTLLLSTAKHDGHLWVICKEYEYAGGAVQFMHHPDCPCHTRQAEKNDE